MSEPVLSRKRQGAQDAVETLETFEAFDKHGLPAFVRGVDAEALYFFLALFRTGTLPRAAEQLGISLSSANRMLAKLRTYWDDPLFVRSGFQMQPTTAANAVMTRCFPSCMCLRICGADILSLNVLRLWGPLNAKILKPSRRCSSMLSPTATVLPTVPATAGLTPKIQTALHW